MSVIILTKHDLHTYETERLLEKFAAKNISVRVCHFINFDIIINKGVYYNGEPIQLPKMVLVRRGAGLSRQELSVIRYFELMGVPCHNSSESVNIVQDKFQSSEILSRAGVAVPNTMIAKFPYNCDLVRDNIGFPCILKVVVGSFGEGVYLCNSEVEYNRVIEFSNALHNEKTLIAQEYLGERPGVDLRVLVVGGKVIGAMQRTAPDGDFRANITNGGTGEYYELTPEIEDISLRAAAALNLDIAGIDLLFDSRGFRVCEANSNPGFSGFEKYCGIDVAEAIVKFVESKI